MANEEKEKNMTVERAIKRACLKVTGKEPTGIQLSSITGMDRNRLMAKIETALKTKNLLTQAELDSIKNWIELETVIKNKIGRE
jgi:ABC-type antimicrobial peptide transport system ATPase subunit